MRGTDGNSRGDLRRGGMEPELDLENMMEEEVRIPSIMTPQPEVEQPKTVKPSKILVCADCREYHDHTEDWEVCPKCGEELIEVTRS